MDSEKLRYTIADDRLNGLEGRVTELEGIVRDLTLQSYQMIMESVMQICMIDTILREDVLPALGLEDRSEEVMVIVKRTLADRLNRYTGG